MRAFFGLPRQLFHRFPGGVRRKQKFARPGVYLHVAPHIPQMRDNLARVMGVDASQVNVKATTEEGLSFTGSGEGMAAHAVVLIERL